MIYSDGIRCHKNFLDMLMIDILLEVYTYVWMMLDKLRVKYYLTLQSIMLLSYTLLED